MSGRSDNNFRLSLLVSKVVAAADLFFKITSSKNQEKPSITSSFERGLAGVVV